MGFSCKQREMALSAKMWARGKGRGLAPEPPHATQSPPEFRGARRRSALTRSCRAPTGSDQKGARWQGALAPQLPRATQSSEFRAKDLRIFMEFECFTDRFIGWFAEVGSRRIGPRKTCFVKSSSDQRTYHLSEKKLCIKRCCVLNDVVNSKMLCIARCCV